MQQCHAASRGRNFPLEVACVLNPCLEGVMRQEISYDDKRLLAHDCGQGGQWVDARGRLEAMGHAQASGAAHLPP